MAEFCFECFKKYIDEFVTEEDVILKEDFCVECACRKPCVISITPAYAQKSVNGEFPLTSSDVG